MVLEKRIFNISSKKTNGVNTLELRYPIAESDVFYQFLNWLEGEFDLYQQDKQSNELVIYYPQIKCVIQKGDLKNKTDARVIIVSKTRILCDRFAKKISEVYHLLDSCYCISK
ncbi:hypothetical protein DHD80_13360 [Gramella sp. AN32]|nr:hypothetical protein [Gramella sp. AN32]